MSDLEVWGTTDEDVYAAVRTAGVDDDRIARHALAFLRTRDAEQCASAARGGNRDERRRLRRECEAYVKRELGVPESVVIGLLLWLPTVIEIGRAVFLLVEWLLSEKSEGYRAKTGRAA